MVAYPYNVVTAGLRGCCSLSLAGEAFSVSATSLWPENKRPRIVCEELKYCVRSSFKEKHLRRAQQLTYLVADGLFLGKSIMRVVSNDEMTCVMWCSYL